MFTENVSYFVKPFTQHDGDKPDLALLECSVSAWKGKVV
jgi:hypothetical protein